MVLSLGLTIISLLVVTLSVNVASLWLTHRNLDGVADAAALAGAQGINGQLLYRSTQMPSQLPIDQVLARRYIAEYLTKSGARQRFPQLRVRSITVQNNQVHVVIATPASLPFGYLLGRSSALVVSAATAVHVTG